MDLTSSHIRIPGFLRQYDEAALLCLLKFGRRWNHSVDLKGWAKSLGVSVGTVRKWLRRCEAHGWINRRGSRIYVRGWKRIGGKRNLKLEKQWLTEFEAYRYAAMLYHLLKIHQLPHPKSRSAAVRKLRRRGKRHILLSDHHGGISCSLGGQKFGCSKTKSWELRIKCESLGIISVQHRRIRRQGIDLRSAWFQNGMKRKGERWEIEDGIVYERITSKIDFLVDLSIS